MEPWTGHQTRTKNVHSRFYKAIGYNKPRKSSFTAIKINQPTIKLLTQLNLLLEEKS